MRLDSSTFKSRGACCKNTSAGAVAVQILWKVDSKTHFWAAEASASAPQPHGPHVFSGYDELHCDDVTNNHPAVARLKVTIIIFVADMHVQINH